MKIHEYFVNKAAAWSVHLFTASGVFFIFLSAVETFSNNYRKAFIYLFVSGFIDAVDGFFARKFQVKKYASNMDGALLDNIIDYIGFVFVPALMVYQAKLVPDNLIFLSCFLILISSCYQFCQTDAKTDDHYFKGFPSYWSILVIYLFLYRENLFLNFILITVCTVLVFVPIKYIYPSRATDFKKSTLLFAALWGIFLIKTLIFSFADPSKLFLVISVLFFAYYAAVSTYITYFKDRKNH